MSLRRRVEELEEGMNAPGDKHCMMIIERAVDEDGREELATLPRCPHGKALSGDLHECDECELVPPARRHHLVIVLDGAAPELPDDRS